MVAILSGGEMSSGIKDNVIIDLDNGLFPIWGQAITGLNLTNKLNIGMIRVK